MQPKLSKFSSRLFISFFLYLILEGILRKWVFPSLGQPLFLFKYVILFVLYVKVFLLEKKRLELPHMYKTMVLFYFLYGLTSFFNIRVADNPIVQFFGLINHFIYIPLIPIFSYYLHNENDFENFVTGLTWICIPIFTLGIFQYYSPQNSFINKYAIEGELGSYDVALSSGRVRITGVFSYLAVYCSFLYGVLLLIFCSIINKMSKNKYDLIKIGTFSFGVMNLFMTGSRSGVLMLAIAIFIYLLGLASTGKASFLKSLIPIAFFGLIAYSVILNTDAGEDSYDNFSGRLEGTNDADIRITRLLSPFMNIDIAGPFGLGIGITYQGTQQYITDRWLLPSYFEEEGDRLVLELGLIGYILILFMRIGILFYNFKTFRESRELSLKSISLIILIFQIPAIFGFANMEFSFMEGIMYWSYGGMQMAIEKINKEQLSSNQNKIAKMIV